MSQTRVPFKKFTEGDFIYEIRRLNRAISKLSYERDDLQQENKKYKEVIDKAIEYLNNVPNITAVVKIPNKPNEELLVGQTLDQKDIIELVKILGRYKGDSNEYR